MDHRVTYSFLHPCKGLIFLVAFVILIGAGCEKKTEDIHAFGKSKDVTEDLYHRLKAGMFDPGTDPFVCKVVEVPHFSSMSALFRRISIIRVKKIPRQIIRVSWERGSFRVQSDDQARVVIYMDEETIFGHVQLSTLKGFGLSSGFREVVKHPYR